MERVRARRAGPATSWTGPRGRDSAASAPPRAPPADGTGAASGRARRRRRRPVRRCGRSVPAARPAVRILSPGMLRSRRLTAQVPRGTPMPPRLLPPPVPSACPRGCPRPRNCCSERSGVTRDSPQAGRRPPAAALRSPAGQGRDAGAMLAGACDRQRAQGACRAPASGSKACRAPTPRLRRGWGARRCARPCGGGWPGIAGGCGAPLRRAPPGTAARCSCRWTVRIAAPPASTRRRM